MLTDYLHDEDEARDGDFLIRRAAIWPIDAGSVLSEQNHVHL